MLSFFEQMQTWPNARLKHAYETGDRAVKRYVIYILEHRPEHTPVWGASLYVRPRPFAIAIPKETESTKVS